MADPIPFTDPEPQFGPMPAFVKEARERRAAGMDQSVAEAQRDAMAAALANLLGQTAGMVSYLPANLTGLPLTREQKDMLSDFSRLSSGRMADASEELSEAAANENLGVLGEAAVRYPVSALAVLPEVYNPFKKADAVLKAPKWTARAMQYTPDVLNAAWHAARGYKSDGATGAAISAGSNIVGEKIVEPLMGVAGRRFGVPYDLAGNAVGAALENLINESRRVQND
jgi:hypothetical protein